MEGLSRTARVLRQLEAEKRAPRGPKLAALQNCRTRASCHGCRGGATSLPLVMSVVGGRGSGGALSRCPGAQWRGQEFPAPVFRGSQKSRKGGREGGGARRVASGGGRPSDPPPMLSNGREGAGKGRDLKVGSSSPILPCPFRVPRTGPPVSPSSTHVRGSEPSPPVSAPKSQSLSTREFTFRTLNVLAFSRSRIGTF